MSERANRWISIVLIVGLLVMSVGCFASFNLTKKVYNFNKGIGDKWVNELVFLVMTVVPVYGIAVTVDVLILNSIEFWTGSNPVSASNDQRIIDLPEAGVTLALGADRSMTLMQKNGEEFVFERAEGETVVKNVQGEVLARCLATADGGIVLKDASGRVLSTYSSADLQNMAERLTLK